MRHLSILIFCLIAGLLLLESCKSTPTKTLPNPFSVFLIYSKLFAPVKTNSLFGLFIKRKKRSTSNNDVMYSLQPNVNLKKKWGRERATIAKFLKTIRNFLPKLHWLSSLFEQEFDSLTLFWSRVLWIPRGRFRKF